MKKNHDFRPISRFVSEMMLIGQAPDYITNLLTLVTNIPSRSSLRACSNGNLFQPRIES